MRDADKPFICYRSLGGLKIVPRNRAGWIAFGWWMAAMLAITLLFLFAMSRLENGPAAGWLTLGYVAATGIWIVAMIVWMKNRSEVVDIEELLRLKREAEQRARRHGR